MFKYAYILLIFLPCQLSAQSKPDYVNLEFSKPNISWIWLGNVSYSQPATKDVGLDFYDEFYTSLLIPSKISPQWRDENRLRTFIYEQRNNISYGLYAVSWLLRDTKGTSVIQAATNAVGFRSEYHPSNNFKIIPYAGYQNAQNRSRTEWGWDLGLSGKLNGMKLGNYRTEIELNSDYDFFKQRQNIKNVLDIRLATEFSASARDTMILQYGNDNQQFFFADTSLLIDNRQENKSMQNILDYSITRSSVIRFSTLLENWRIKDDRPGDIDRREIFKLRNRINYQSISGSLQFNFGFDTYLETEDNLGLKRDSEERQTGLNTSVSYIAGKSDKFDLQLSYIKFQYDTPDSNNDDRDELRFIGLLSHEHQFSDYLSSRLEFYTYLYHRIYLRKEQSANNVWNRRFWLDAEVSYNKDDLKNVFHSQVLAIYTVFDYDNLFNETKSFVFRKYLVSDSVLIPVYKGLYCGLFGRLELEDRGSFIEDIFSQKLIESAQTVYFDMFIRKILLYRFRWDFGYAVSTYTGWRHVPQKKRIREKEKHTQYMRIIYPLNQQLKIAGQIAFTFENDKGREKINYRTGNINLYYTF